VREGSTSKAHIVSLLRTTCVEGNPVVESENTWNEIQTFVATEEGKAKVIRLAELPEHLKRRHGRARAADLTSLAELKAAADTVLARSRDTILGVPIARVELETKVATALATTRVVLITGAAGCPAPAERAAWGAPDCLRFCAGLHPSCRGSGRNHLALHPIN
jgi:hypothetical protein